MSWIKSFFLEETTAPELFCLGLCAASWRPVVSLAYWVFHIPWPIASASQPCSVADTVGGNAQEQPEFTEWSCLSTYWPGREKWIKLSVPGGVHSLTAVVSTVYPVVRVPSMGIWATDPGGITTLACWNFLVNPADNSIVTYFPHSLPVGIKIKALLP